MWWRRKRRRKRTRRRRRRSNPNAGLLKIQLPVPMQRCTEREMSFQYQELTRWGQFLILTGSSGCWLGGYTFAVTLLRLAQRDLHTIGAIAVGEFGVRAFRDVRFDLLPVVLV